MIDEKIMKYVERLENLEMKINERSMLSHYQIPNEVRESDLSMKHLMILLSLSIKDNSTMGELSEKLSMNLSTLTRAVDKLVEESFVIRQNDPGDRRIVRISLSSKAKSVLDNIKNQRRELIASILSNVAEEEREKLVGLLENLIAILSGSPVP